MKTSVHNKIEAKVLTKEWNKSGQFAGESVNFYSHETNQLIAYAIWNDATSAFTFKEAN